MFKPTVVRRSTAVKSAEDKYNIPSVPCYIPLGPDGPASLNDSIGDSFFDRSLIESSFLELTDEKTKPKKCEPKKCEPKKCEPKKCEPKKSEPKKCELTKSELTKSEPKKCEPKKSEPKKELKGSGQRRSLSELYRLDTFAVVNPSKHTTRPVRGRSKSPVRLAAVEPAEETRPKRPVMPEQKAIPFNFAARKAAVRRSMPVQNEVVKTAPKSGEPLVRRSERLTNKKLMNGADASQPRWKV